MTTTQIITSEARLSIVDLKASGKWDAYSPYISRQDETHVFIPDEDFRRIKASFQVKVISHQEEPSLIQQGINIVKSSAKAVKSVVKTTAGIGRTTNEQYEARLDKCRNLNGDGKPCPHAVMTKKGELSTCGPMVESMRKAGKGTCGCVLRIKAKDAKEDCPFGYWPKVTE